MDQDEQTNARDDADQHTGTGSRASRIGRHGRRLFEGAGVRARAGYAMAQGRLRNR